MSLLKKIVSIGFEVHEDPKVAPVSAPVSAPQAPSFPSTPQVASEDPKVLEFLENLLVAKNLPGYDYLEHVATEENLVQAVPDKATRIKAALAMAKTMGATKESILASIDVYLKHLDEQAAAFSHDSSEKIKAVLDKEQGLSKFDQQIQSLQRQMEELNAQKAAEKTKIDSEKQELYKVRDSFGVTYQKFKDKLVFDKAAIQGS